MSGGPGYFGGGIRTGHTPGREYWYLAVQVYLMEIKCDCGIWRV